MHEKFDTIPRRFQATSLGDYLEVMTRAVFQAGLSWELIASRWNTFRRSFSNFAVDKVAHLQERQIQRLANDPRLVRSEKKVRATVSNAATLLELEARPDGFRGYLRSFETYGALRDDLRKRFRHLGEVGVWYFLFVVGEDVPPLEACVSGDHPRMREMVERARREGTCL